MGSSRKSSRGLATPHGDVDPFALPPGKVANQLPGMRAEIDRGQRLSTAIAIRRQ